MSRPELYSESAEQAVLSAMLLDGAVIPDVRVMLSPDSFDRPAHQVIYSAMCGLVDRGSTVDPLTLSDTLEASGELTKAGGREYVAYLVDVVPTAANVSYHAGIVRELAERREVIRTCEAAIAAAQDRAVPVPDVAQQVTSALLPAAAGTDRGGFVPLADLVYGVMDDIEASARGEGKAASWGFTDLDRITGGIEPGEVAFLCSVPGGCKTALALNIALAAAERGEGVAFISAEMKDRQLVKRLLSNRAQVAGKALRLGTLVDTEFVRIGHTLGGFKALPFWIDDTPQPDIQTTWAKLRALKAKYPKLRWVLGDFIQLFESKTHTREGRARELGLISYAFPSICKELDLSGVVTVQVDAQAVEQRPDRRPQIRDLAWSQAMRQAGHFVGMMYRPAMYDSTVIEDVLEVDFQKARELEPFKVTFKWRGQFMRVENMERAA